mmetsp:Transcript_35415/g.119917  ORF Transcript_35415/g.119917 Transcript_35415/m.119917 type:complete len:231 (-) Transcript_35415:295-987(-)
MARSFRAATSRFTSTFQLEKQRKRVRASLLPMAMAIFRFCSRRRRAISATSRRARSRRPAYWTRRAIFARRVSRRQETWHRASVRCSRLPQANLIFATWSRRRRAISATSRRAFEDRQQFWNMRAPFFSRLWSLNHFLSAALPYMRQHLRRSLRARCVWTRARLSSMRDFLHFQARWILCALASTWSASRHSWQQAQMARFMSAANCLRRRWSRAARQTMRRVRYQCWMT